MGILQENLTTPKIADCMSLNNVQVYSPWSTKNGPRLQGLVKKAMAYEDIERVGDRRFWYGLVGQCYPINLHSAVRVIMSKSFTVFRQPRPAIVQIKVYDIATSAQTVNITLQLEDGSMESLLERLINDEHIK